MVGHVLILFTKSKFFWTIINYLLAFQDENIIWFSLFTSASWWLALFICQVTRLTLLFHLGLPLVQQDVAVSAGFLFNRLFNWCHGNFEIVIVFRLVFVHFVVIFLQKFRYFWELIWLRLHQWRLLIKQTWQLWELIRVVLGLLVLRQGREISKHGDILCLCAAQDIVGWDDVS